MFTPTSIDGLLIGKLRTHLKVEGYSLSIQMRERISKPSEKRWNRSIPRRSPIGLHGGGRIPSC